MPRIPDNIDLVWRRAKSGDTEAEQRLVDIYEYLVYQITARGDTEAQSEAFLALVYAIRRFDPDRGFQAQTYIARSIQHAVGKLNAKRERHNERNRNIEYIEYDHQNENDNDYNDDTRQLNWLLDHNATTADDIIDRTLLNEIIDSLPERDRKILTLYSEGHRIVDIARTIGVCRAWLHQLINDIRSRIGLATIEDWSQIDPDDQADGEGGMGIIPTADINDDHPGRNAYAS